MRARLLTAVAAVGALALIPGTAQPKTSHPALSFISRRDLHPAPLLVSVERPGLASGLIFVAPLTNTSVRGRMVGQYGPLIVDDHGNPVWEHPVGRGLVAMNFRMQTYRGAPVLTWWQGRITPQGFGYGEDVIMDSSYRVLKVVHAGHGVSADLHEFTLTPSGRAIITAFRTVRHDERSVGGPRDGTVMDSVVQEIDVRSGRMLLEWDPLRHVDPADSRTRPSGRTPWDAYHVNSVEVDGRGNMLVSMRNTWAIYRVSVRSGRVLWTLGGRHSTFRLARGVQFHWQHDAHLASHTRLTVFDNGAAPPVERQSRALAIHLDSGRRTARLERVYTHPKPPVLAFSQGSMQDLANGDVFTGWGAQPYVSEFAANGALLLDAHFPLPDESYRAYRFHWVGRPLHGPSVAVRRSGGTAVVYASWNGATEVASWRVLAGPSPSSLRPVGDAARTGFETAVGTSDPGPWFAAEALGADGRSLGVSGAVQG